MNIFTKKLLAIFTLSIASIAGLAQTLGDYRSAADGTWADRNDWQRWNGSAWVTPTVGEGYPGFSSTPTLVTIQQPHDIALDVAGTVTIGSLVLAGDAICCGFNGGTLTTTGNPSLTINNNLTINTTWADATFGGSGTLTVTGTIAVAGGSFFTRNGSGNTIVGILDVDLLGFFTQSSTGNLTVNGTSQIDGFFVDDETTGVTTFTGLATVGGLGSFTSTAVTQENRMIFNGGVTNSGAFTAGGIQLATNRTITANAAMTIQSGMDCDGNLTISGTNTVTVTGDESNIAPLGSTGGAAGNLTINATLVLTGTAGSGVLDVTGNTIVNGVLTLNSASQGNADFHGTFTNSGNFTDSNNSGINIFYDQVTNSGNWTTTTVTTPANMIFQNGIANNGNFSTGTGTFNTRDQSLTGGNTITFTSSAVVTGFTVTNSNTSAVTMSASAAVVLSGTGTWTQGAGSTLNYAGSTLTVNTFNASNALNTVNYNRPGNAAVRDPSASTYHHLTLSGTNIKSSSGDHNINGNLTISGSTQFDVNAGTDNISVGSNWDVTSSNGDPFVQGAQTVTFDGAAAQTLTTALAAGETFNNLIINNTFVTSPQLTFNDNVTISGVLTMTDGNVNLNGTTLILSNSAAGALAHGLTSASGWMYGGTFRRTFLSSTAIAIGNVRGFFPLGSSTDWRPFFVGVNSIANTAGTISVTHNNSATTSNVSIGDTGPVATIVKRHDSNWAVTTATMSAGTWILRAGGDNFGTIAAGAADIRLSTAAGVVGTHGAGSGGPTDWRVNRTGLTFGQLTNSFHVASTNGSTSPLPIKLTYFNARLINDQVDLDWETAQELNNDFFTVEKTSDLESFEEVVMIKGHGTSQQVHHYSAADINPYFGRSYYRLKQTDFDGTFTYSKVQMIDYNGPEFAFLRAYPSPASGQKITIEIKGLKETKSVPLQIVNAQGQKIMEKTFEVKIPGMLKEELTFDSSLPSGLYIIKAGNTFQLTQKVVVE